MYPDIVDMDIGRVQHPVMTNNSILQCTLKKYEHTSQHKILYVNHCNAIIHNSLNMETNQMPIR